MPRRMSDALATFALVTLDGAFTGRGWQGPTLQGALRGVSASEALWRPGADRRCIWEHVLHAAYWKYAILRVLTPEDPGEFKRIPSNWPAVPSPKAPVRDLEKLWKADKAYLAANHARLRRAVQAFDYSRLHSRPPSAKGGKRGWTYAQYLAGAAAHDCYHLGQIQLLKRLLRHR